MVITLEDTLGPGRNDVLEREWRMAEQSASPMAPKFFELQLFKALFVVRNDNPHAQTNSTYISLWSALFLRIQTLPTISTKRRENEPFC
jgi:hypothetical protein